MAGEDWFGGISDANDSGTGNWFKRGVYVAEVVRITQKISEDPAKKGAKLVIAEFRVRKVISAYPEGSQAVGELAAAMFDMSSAYKSMHLGRLRSLISSAIGDVQDGIGKNAAKIKSENPGLSEALCLDMAWGALASKVTTPPGETLAGSLVLVDASAAVTTKGRKQTIYPARFSSLPADIAAEFEG